MPTIAPSESNWSVELTGYGVGAAVGAAGVVSTAAISFNTISVSVWISVLLLANESVNEDCSALKNAVLLLVCTTDSNAAVNCVKLTSLPPAAVLSVSISICAFSVMMKLTTALVVTMAARRRLDDSWTVILCTLLLATPVTTHMAFTTESPSNLFSSADNEDTFTPPSDIEVWITTVAGVGATVGAMDGWTDGIAEEGRTVGELVCPMTVGG